MAIPFVISWMNAETAMMNGALLTPEISLALEGLLSKYRVIERIVVSGGVNS